VNENSIKLAAQADAVLLTVDMLSSPQSLAQANQSPWFEITNQELDELLRAGFGEAGERSLDQPSNPSLRSALDDVHRSAQALDADVWSDEYCRLFDGATACPLNQASYVRRDKGTILGDLSGFYNAFGFQGSNTQGERPDHLLCQLEFVAMLLAMASRAPDADANQIVMDALSQYANVHMHDWLPTVCWQMCEATEIEYFAAVAQWLKVLWDSLTELHQWPIDQVPDQHLEPAVEPENPYECGAPDLHQIQVNDESTA
jgi:TorA maturation chaperone TorD